MIAAQTANCFAQLTSQQLAKFSKVLKSYLRLHPDLCDGVMQDTLKAVADRIQYHGGDDRSIDAYLIATAHCKLRSALASRQTPAPGFSLSAEQYTHLEKLLRKRLTYIIGDLRDDVIQDTLLLLAGAIARQPKTIDDLDSYTLKIARNRYLTIVRSEARRRQHLARFTSERGDSEVEQFTRLPNLDADELGNREIIRRLLEKLPSKIRQIINLRLQKTPFQEIAATVGGTKNSVCKAYNHAVKRIHRIARKHKIEYAA